MLDEIATTARSAASVGAFIYLSAFLFGMITLLRRKPYPRSIMFALLLSGFIFQVLGLNLRGIQVKGCPLGNLFEISQFISWSLVLLYFIVGTAFSLRSLGLFTAGLASCLSISSLLIPSWDEPYATGTTKIDPWIELHASLAIFSYAIFAIVALVSFMFLIQQHGLKKKQFKGLYEYLPSVQILDLVAKRLLITGVTVLSAALVFGIVFWVNYPERVPLSKLLPTCLVWIGYLTVVVLGIKKQLVTRRRAIASIALFIFAIASLWPVQSARDEHREPSKSALETNQALDEPASK
ncbi:MAG: ABC-type uncharacterized transport system permease subunit [Lentimonas sp.]|jgi:ABC-type uncharacterized transport system permease subunit